MKTCRLCGMTGDLDKFEKDKVSKDGRSTRCKECARKKQKKYNAKSSVTGERRTRAKARKESSRQELIVRYGLAVVEAMESSS